MITPPESIYHPCTNLNGNFRYSYDASKSSKTMKIYDKRNNDKLVWSKSNVTYKQDNDNKLKVYDSDGYCVCKVDKIGW